MIYGRMVVLISLFIVAVLTIMELLTHITDGSTEINPTMMTLLIIGLIIMVIFIITCIKSIKKEYRQLKHMESK